jgi:hypothetical protein
MSVEKTKSKFNPKLGNGFENAKFGEGSILVNIDAAGLDAAMKNLQVGSSILLKYNKVTTKGNKHYFAEILPPWKGSSSNNLD